MAGCEGSVGSVGVTNPTGPGVSSGAESVDIGGGPPTRRWPGNRKRGIRRPAAPGELSELYAAAGLAVKDSQRWALLPYVRDLVSAGLIVNDMHKWGGVLYVSRRGVGEPQCDVASWGARLSAALRLIVMGRQECWDRRLGTWRQVVMLQVDERWQALKTTPGLSYRRRRTFIGSTMRQWRRQRGLSQVAAALAHGLDRSAWAWCEAGVACPALPLWRAVCVDLGLDWRLGLLRWLEVKLGEERGALGQIRQVTEGLGGNGQGACGAQPRNQGG
jgi:hypothetical protein